jgi:anti-anti-sigma factor
VPEHSIRRMQSVRGVAPFRVRSSHDGDTRSIALSGELDLATAPTLEVELEGARGAHATLIVLDMRELEFIDSTGLRLILQAHRRSPGQLLILGCPERVLRAFALCGLLELLTFVDEIPARNTAKTAAGDAADAAADRSRAACGATVRRALRPRAAHPAMAAPTRPLAPSGSDGA